MNGKCILLSGRNWIPKTNTQCDNVCISLSLKKGQNYVEIMKNHNCQKLKLGEGLDSKEHDKHFGVTGTFLCAVLMWFVCVCVEGAYPAVFRNY